MELPPLASNKHRALENDRPRPLAVAPAFDADAARETAKAFESAFLTEMLKHTGLNKTSQTMGGGAGEDAFSSFLTEEYAKKLTESGGIGLAEQIFNAIKQKGSST
jgi:peptidoglycan hydrolase FlgJ